MKSQKYDVNFRVEVKNLSPRENLVQIIMPFPLESSYQKLLGKRSISPKGEVKVENKFQNKYVYWEQNLKPKEEKIFELKFKVSVKSRNKIVKNNENLSIFLKKDKFIDPKSVLDLSNNLVRDTKDDFEKVKILNDYVVNKLKYGNPIKGLYTTKDALEKNLVDCGGFDSLLVSLCIAQKIPARIVCGFFANVNNEMHAWVEIFIPGKSWIVADPSIENLSKEGRSEKRADLGFMDSDTIALSIGQNLNLKIGGKSFKLDILQNPEVFAENGEKSIQLESEFKANKIYKNLIKDLEFLKISKI